jgi:hypothetical protein
MMLSKPGDLLSIYMTGVNSFFVPSFFPNAGIKLHFSNVVAIFLLSLIP